MDLLRRFRILPLQQLEPRRRSFEGVVGSARGVSYYWHLIERGLLTLATCRQSVHSLFSSTGFDVENGPDEPHMAGAAANGRRVR